MRLKRGWSQQQLADASGLSARTIQRIESGTPASTETLKCLAAVFDVPFDTLSQEPAMQKSTDTSHEARLNQEYAAFRHVRKLRGFYIHLLQMLPVALLLGAVNAWVSPHRLWAPWVVLFMLLGLGMHALYVFGTERWFGAKWELRQIEKRLGRTLS